MQTKIDSRVRQKPREQRIRFPGLNVQTGLKTGRIEKIVRFVVVSDVVRRRDQAAGRFYRILAIAADRDRFDDLIAVRRYRRMKNLDVDRVAVAAAQFHLPLRIVLRLGQDQIAFLSTLSAVEENGSFIICAISLMFMLRVFNKRKISIRCGELSARATLNSSSGFSSDKSNFFSMSTV